MRRIITIVLTLTIIAGGIGVATPSAQAAPLSSGHTQIVASDFKEGACDGISQLGGANPCNNSGAAETQISGIVSSIVNLLSIVVGIVAVIMIIVSGFKYITAAGDSAKVSSAKNTLIYAIVGLIIAALAQFIVHVVLDNL